MLKLPQIILTRGAKQLVERGIIDDIEWVTLLLKKMGAWAEGVKVTFSDSTLEECSEIAINSIACMLSGPPCWMVVNVLLLKDSLPINNKFPFFILHCLWKPIQSDFHCEVFRKKLVQCEEMQLSLEPGEACPVHLWLLGLSIEINLAYSLCIQLSDLQCPWNKSLIRFNSVSLLFVLHKGYFISPGNAGWNVNLILSLIKVSFLQQEMSLLCWILSAQTDPTIILNFTAYWQFSVIT